MIQLSRLENQSAFLILSIQAVQNQTENPSKLHRSLELGLKQSTKSRSTGAFPNLLH